VVSRWAFYGSTVSNHLTSAESDDFFGRLSSEALLNQSRETFRLANNLMMPFRLNQEMNEVNTPLDDSIFQMPEKSNPKK
jgi:hypothetical protein